MHESSPQGFLFMLWVWIRHYDTTEWTEKHNLQHNAILLFWQSETVRHVASWYYSWRLGLSWVMCQSSCRAASLTSPYPPDSVVDVHSRCFLSLVNSSSDAFYVCQLLNWLLLASFWDIKVLLFNFMVAIVTLCSCLWCLFLHLSVFFFPCFLLIFHMQGDTLQNGQSWPGRKICTFSIFVLCTALLILNPTIYYLNPSIKRKSP